MNRAWPTLLFSGFSTIAMAAQCPQGAPATDYSMAAAPSKGQVSVTIDRRVAAPFTVCFDSDTVDAQNVKTGDSTSFEFAVPAGGQDGVHQVSVVAGGVVYLTKLGAPKLALYSVSSVLMGPAQDTFEVHLNGQGFDADNKTYNKIQMDDYPVQVCWSDSECAARNLTVRGDVQAAGQVITLQGLDPTMERGARFRVFLNGHPTGYQTEADASSQYWLTIGISALVTILLAGLVILLLKWCLRPTVIHGDNYVGRALFLDKETNTYSLSKLQFYLWTLVAIFGYVYLLISKNIFQHYFGLPAVPAGLPGIVGIAGGTAVGAQVVTNINGPKGSGQIKPSVADFVTTGDVVAAERVQFFVWTIIGAMGFVLAVVRLDPRVLKDLPDVPSSLLAISGLSAFGYLGGKLARNPGPVISEVMVHAGPDPEAVVGDATTTAAPTTTPMAAPTTTPAPAVDNTTTYGIIELRGRMLSQDANFRVSLGEESGPDDVDISFDALVPSPNDDKHLKKPRIIEKDDDSSDKSMAKRLLLVIDVSPKTRAQFVQATKHTITIINPDSQKAVFKFQVPESQAPA